MTSTAAELIAEARRPDGHTASGWGKLAKDLADALDVADRALTVDWAENITAEDESAIRRHMHELAVRNTALAAPRVVSTVAELDALPVGTIVRFMDGDVWKTVGRRGYIEVPANRPSWYSTADNKPFPATVLWVGGTE